MKKIKKQKLTKIISCITLIIVILITGYQKEETTEILNDIKTSIIGINKIEKSYSIEKIPEYNNSPYIIINGNNPNFKEKDLTLNSFEKYSSLDDLNRCGIAYANISKETMPTEKRGRIGMIKPTGWHTVKYDIVEGKYLYNRCHLIGYQLTGENANEKNLITCTRNMNTTGMLEFENKVAEYVKETNNHVLYRVTPIFENNNLLAKGVQMEAISVEDQGKGIKYNVFVYNVQDGIDIDYKTGESKLSTN